VTASIFHLFSVIFRYVAHSIFCAQGYAKLWFRHLFRLPFIDCWALALSSPDLSTTSRQTGYRKKYRKQKKKKKKKKERKKKKKKKQNPILAQNLRFFCSLFLFKHTINLNE